jgi:sec-independent protein translocase protein TatB
MFDVGFSELMVIAIVALVVIGPERLPKVARTAGLLFGRLQRYVNDVKADVSRELQLDELKKMQADMQESARSFERSISSEMQTVEQTVNETVLSAQTYVQDLAPTSDALALPEAPAVPPVVPGDAAGPAESSSPAARV